MRPKRARRAYSRRVLEVKIWGPREDIDGARLSSSNFTNDDSEVDDSTKTVLATREAKQEIRVTEDDDADGDGGNHRLPLNHPPRALSVSLLKSEEPSRPPLLAPASSIRRLLSGHHFLSSRRQQWLYFTALPSPEAHLRIYRRATDSGRGGAPARVREALTRISQFD